MVIIGTVFSVYVIAEPAGPRLISNSTDAYIPQSALMRNDSKGTITTLSLNVTEQSTKWKAYVGNVTGRLTLDNSNNRTIYDWTYTRGEGEVYATRGSSVTWSTLMCANSTTVSSEETSLNHVTSQPDSISNTFVNNTHPQFYVGSTLFSQNTCGYDAYTFVNGSQTSSFPEIMLYDTTNSEIIFTSIMSNQSLGYDENHYDFQMLVPEDSSSDENHAYYFYVELSS